MAGQKLEEAKLGVTLLLGRLRGGRGDYAGLLTFSDVVELLVELGPIPNVVHQIIGSVSSLSADGGTALVDGILMALRRMPAGSRAIRAVVVLTDGCENRSKSSVGNLLSAIAGFGPGAPRVYCLSYGEDADTELLRQIASESNGVAYAGTYFGIEELFERIGYHF
jgi:Mg-chelatase subunit ChlD